MRAEVRVHIAERVGVEQELNKSLVGVGWECQRKGLGWLISWYS